MVENEKALKEALDKLEKCCPGSTRVSHMNTASSILHKALIELDLARSQEQHLREESDALLEGISIIMNSENIGIAFKKVLEILKRLIKFDDAFILREHNGPDFSVVVSSSPQYEDILWQHDLMTKYVLNEGLTNIRNINYSAEWRQQPSKIRQNVISALHVALKVSNENAILICTSSKENYFNKSHIQLIKRFAPLACQALYSLKINELLDNEKSKRKDAEERLEKLLKKQQNNKV